MKSSIKNSKERVSLLYPGKEEDSSKHISILYLRIFWRNNSLERKCYFYKIFTREYWDIGYSKLVITSVCNHRMDAEQIAYLYYNIR